MARKPRWKAETDPVKLQAAYGWQPDPEWQLFMRDVENLEQNIEIHLRECEAMIYASLSDKHAQFLGVGSCGKITVIAWRQSE